MNRAQANTLKVVGGVVGGLALVALAAVVIDEIAKANTPPAIPPHSEEAVGIDWVLYYGLLALSQDETKPSWLRIKASLGARTYKQHWLDEGNAGCYVDPDFKRRTYGNWCGAGCGGGKPIDEIDELCRQHDQARQAAFARMGIVEFPVYA